MPFLRTFAAMAAMLGLSGNGVAGDYAPGQVWSYRTRPQDAGSLLKIQRVEMLGPTRVYHISVVGVRFAGSSLNGTVSHLPVSDATLDASVTKRQTVSDFPSTPFEEGIAEWRRANGGVFTISIAEIMDVVEQTAAS